VSQVLDYSAGRPRARVVKQQGFAGAVRYIGFPDRTKCITEAEFNDYKAEGLGIALVFEDNAVDWHGGFGQGQVSARKGRDHANAIGFPADHPIYMAVDSQVIGTANHNLAMEYLRGAATSLGGVDKTGVYGQASVCALARDRGLAFWRWQTKAWSGGVVSSGIHLLQQIGTVNVDGIGCDINDVYQDDWGQYGGEDIVDQAQFDTFMNSWMNRTYIVGADGTARRFLDHMQQESVWVGGALHAAEGIPAAIAPQFTTLGNLLVAAIQDDGQTVELSPEDVQTLLAGLGPATKSAVKEALREGTE
jgi:hypothetical protein